MHVDFAFYSKQELLGPQGDCRQESRKRRMVQANYHWEKAPDGLRIEPGMVHLWRLSIPAAIPHLAALVRCLTPEEEARGRRFQVSPPRNSFLIGRSVLRLLLSRYTHTLAQDLRIRYTSSGKPYLDEADKGLGLTFNLSHSGDWLVYAFGRAEMLGVDIEFQRKSIQPTEIAKRFFSAKELAFLLQFDVNERQRIFYELWVRKEACLKAMGTGLAQSLRNLELPFVEKAAVSFQLPHHAASGKIWWLYPFSIADDYSCALVCSPPPASVRHFGWALQA